MTLNRPLKLAQRAVRKVRKTGKRPAQHSAQFLCAGCGAAGTCWDDSAADAQRAATVARCPSCGGRNTALTTFALWTVGKTFIAAPLYVAVPYFFIREAVWWLILLLTVVTKDSPWIGYAQGGISVATGAWFAISFGVGEYREARDAVVHPADSQG